jgi:hypothetical protein
LPEFGRGVLGAPECRESDTQGGGMTACKKGRVHGRLFFFLFCLNENPNEAYHVLRYVNTVA